MPIQSLKDLLEATPQEIFDQAAPHLLSQGARSSEWESIDCGALSPIECWRCVFADSIGRRCAVGCFMDDADIQAAQSWGWVDPTDLPIWDGITEDQRRVLAGLQNIHDEIPVPEWEEYLLGLARRHNLSAACLVS